MVELYFLLYRIPQMMTRLARERNRSALAWSLIGIGAWLGAEIVVMFGAGVLYGAGSILLGWAEEIPAGVRLLLYIMALGAAIASVSIVRRILAGRSQETRVSLPPPPPAF